MKVFKLDLSNKNVIGDGTRVMFLVAPFTETEFTYDKFEVTLDYEDTIPCWICLKVSDSKHGHLQPLVNIRRREMYIIPTCSLQCANKADGKVNAWLDKILN